MELLKKILGARKGRAEKKATIQDVIANLKLLSKGEKHLSEFYRLCGEVHADEKAFWHVLAASERGHSDAALQMAKLIEKDPGKYTPGESFDAASIRLFGLHLSGLVERMQAGEISRAELLAIAADIESSAVELSYGKIVVTDVPAYRAIARKIERETEDHRKAIERRLRA